MYGTAAVWSLAPLSIVNSSASPLPPRKIRPPGCYDDFRVGSNGGQLLGGAQLSPLRWGDDAGDRGVRETAHMLHTGTLERREVFRPSWRG
jgi:hypothetical protein